MKLSRHSRPDIVTISSSKYSLTTMDAINAIVTRIMAAKLTVIHRGMESSYVIQPDWGDESWPSSPSKEDGVERQFCIQWRRLRVSSADHSAILCWLLLDALTIRTTSSFQRCFESKWKSASDWPGRLPTLVFDMRFSFVRESPTSPFVPKRIVGKSPSAPAVQCRERGEAAAERKSPRCGLGLEEV